MTSQQARTHAIDMKSILRGPIDQAETSEVCIKVDNLNLFYGEKQALHGINMDIPKKRSPPISAPAAAANRRCCVASTG